MPSVGVAIVSWSEERYVIGGFELGSVANLF